MSVIISGGGDGLYLPAAISEAPLPFAASFPTSLSVGLVSAYVFLGPPLLRAAIAILAQTSRKWLFPAVIAIHYVSAALYVAHYWSDEFNDPYRNVAQIVRYDAAYLAAFMAIYLLGQIWLWRSFAKYSPVELISAT